MSSGRLQAGDNKGGWPDSGLDVFRPGETHHHRVGRTVRENDNDRQWKLLLPIMPTLHGTHQTILSDCLVLNNYLTIKKRKN